MCVALYEMCVESSLAEVVEIRASETRKTRPIPLATVALQKRMANERMASEDTMRVINLRSGI
jgi:DNA topoisomerase IA